VTYLLRLSCHLQVFKHNEQELQRFFEFYGPSARDCYGFCADLSSDRALIEDRTRSMTWPTITDALKGTKTLRLDEGSQNVILIKPDPKNCEAYHASTITKAVGRILSEQDTNERWRTLHNLYRTMRLDPLNKSSAGGSWSHHFKHWS
jgi:hypothetical protein